MSQIMMSFIAIGDFCVGTYSADSVKNFSKEKKG
jgi:hypothetical protein